MRGLDFDRGDWAGAFGDLGTLLPFVLAYTSIVGLQPAALLVTFGLAAIGAGLVYRTPMAVQPMKVIGIAAAGGTLHGFDIGAEMVYLAALITGGFWLVVSAAGAIEALARWVGRAVVAGLVLGLGLTFVRQGAGLMADGWVLALAALAVGLLLKPRGRVPSMFLLLLLGAAVVAWQSGGVALPAPVLTLPAATWDTLSATDASLWAGALLLTVSQLPLTFGNAVLAVREQNDRLFPDRPAGVRRLGFTTGAMNLVSGAFGGMAMCHGAGGLAAQVRFGARSGAAPVIIGSVALLAGLLFAEPALELARRFPQPILGAMLVLAGAQLAAGAFRANDLDRGEVLVLVVTAGVALWHVGAAFVLGMVLHGLWFRRWLQW